MHRGKQIMAANEVVNMLARKWNDQVKYPVRSFLWSLWSDSNIIADALKLNMDVMGIPSQINEIGLEIFHEELLSGDSDKPWVLLTPLSTLEFAMGKKV